MTYFNSRNTMYRSPVGAVAAGTAVHFRITVPRVQQCSAAYLLVHRSGGDTACLGMFWCGMNGDDHEWWECHFTPEEAGIYFYHFELRTNHGHSALHKDLGGEACTTGTADWQLTAYAADFRTPDWLAGGIFYQIFPDRFYNSGTPKADSRFPRSFHRNWLEEPGWQPDETGEITNSDFFGGDLNGIRMKLDYLAELGVTCLYLNPIFESQSNHRYNTANYEQIDPTLGTEEDFRALCAAAREKGIRILLDGVFSHTGSDSLYFNRDRRYGDGGAYNDPHSPYYDWYSFRRWPDDYECWWDFLTLPNVREETPAYDRYINGPQGIVRKWLRAGAAGWRLDVADELPDGFLDSLTRAVKAENPEAVVLGEVWEDASNKTAYGVRRRYLLGKQLDSVMNYPFRDAIFGFLLGEHASWMMEQVENIVENYPPQVLRLLMNHIGTHDTERALTALGNESSENHDRSWQSGRVMTEEQRELAKTRLRLATVLQYTLPGVPCIYYGDEAGMEGYRDPFNRACYPWGQADDELLQWYRRLAKLRQANKDILAEGGFRRVYAHGDVFSFERYTDTAKGRSILFVAVNRGSENAQLPVFYENARYVFGAGFLPDAAEQGLKLPPYSFSVLRIDPDGAAPAQ